MAQFTAPLRNAVADMSLLVEQNLPPALKLLLQDKQADEVHLECQLLVTDKSANQGNTRIPIASVNMTTILAAPTVPNYHVLTSGTGQSTKLCEVGMTASSQDGSCSQVLGNNPKLPSERKAATDGACVTTSLVATSRKQKNQELRQQYMHTESTPIPLNGDSALEKLVTGVWRALFDEPLDFRNVFEKHVAMSGGPNMELLGNESSYNRTNAGSESTNSREAFSRVNWVARNVTQTSKVCRAIEVVVQALWIQFFDRRVEMLAEKDTPEGAKKGVMAEACSDFEWSEKQLRNKMTIWRAYRDVALHGGYVPIIFAGPGLYRFCKYWLGSNAETLRRLGQLRQGWEVAADSLQPSWRALLNALGVRQERRYTGHVHDWVLSESSEEAVPLASTYWQWDKNFSYKHITESVVDEKVWGQDDPRIALPTMDVPICVLCEEAQVDNELHNACKCFPTVYGQKARKLPPVQIRRTLNGKNNGLFACVQFPRGEAIGEFVGLITSGLTGLDVMSGHTEKGSYQIWQGKSGNYTRFVNHSCKPNSQFELFHWRGTQRIVLVSLGIAPGEEITVDYSDMYWEASSVVHSVWIGTKSLQGLDKDCLCGERECKYSRNAHRWQTARAIGYDQPEVLN